MTNNWAVKRLDEVATVTMGQSPPSSSYNDAGQGVPFFQGKPSNIDNLGVASPYQYTTEPTKIVTAGTALMTVRAPVGEIFSTPQDVCIGRGLSGIKANEDISQGFLNYNLQYATDQFHSLSQGTTFSAINSDDLKGIKVVLPPQSTQQKIADILSTLDQAIQKIDQIVQKTEVLKQGLMQQVLALGKSKTSTLKEVLDFIIDHRGLTPKKLGGDWSATGMPALSAMNVKNGKIVNHDQIRFVDDALYKKWMPNELRKDDILLTSEAPLGEDYIVKDNERYCLSQRLFALRPNLSIIRSDYLYYFLISGFGRKALMDRSSGTTAKGIRQAELVKIKIHLPSLSEQEKIGALFSSLDQKIDFEKNRKTKLILTKQGLMQDIFSQKVQII